MYQVQRIARSERVSIRGLPYHVQIWGEPGPDKVPLVMVHGWMDVAASYQFVVDAFSQDHYIIAPDWRGFGQTPSTAHSGHRVDSFWFADYLADLDFLLDHYAPDQAVNLVGHSMGGNVVLLYAGVRPQRVRRVVNLEGFGLPATQPDQAPQRYASWMDELKKLHRGEMDLKAYDSCAGVARRLMKTNPRLSAGKAHWLAQHWAQPNAQGQWMVLGEPGHKVSSAHLFRLDEVLALYRQATMPVLCVEASDDSLALWWKGKFTRTQYHDRIQCIPQLEIAVIQDAGHMMHHDQPQALAALIDRFIQ